MATPWKLEIDWDGDGQFTGTGVDVTARALVRGGLSAGYGRDQARSLAPVAPGSMSFELNNRSRDYSPDNPSSPLVGKLLPSRPVRWSRAGTTTALSNPGFETNTTGWQASGGALARVTTEHHSGVAAGRLTPTGSAARPAVECQNAATLDVTGGLPYTLTAWVKFTAGWDYVLAELQWEDAGASAVDLTVGTTIDVAAATWTQVTVTGTAPYDAVKVRLRIVADQTPDATDIMYVDDVTFGQADPVLFRGYTDDFDVLPNPLDRSVRVTCTDALSRIGGAQLSTGVHDGIRTGAAIGLILDRIGWPSNMRDLDLGATVIRWWWEEGTDSWEAIQALVESEGPPALVSVDSAGRFVFRDRHHRIQRPRSLDVQATFRATGAEPKFSQPLTYDHGWRDVINQVVFSVEHRDPSPSPEVVWSDDSAILIPAGGTRVINVEATDPFIGAIQPVQGIDYTYVSGAVNVRLFRTSGQSTAITISAPTMASKITGLSLRAYPLAVRNTVQVKSEDTTSQGKYGTRAYPNEAKWAAEEDAQAIADTIVAYRSERRPTLSLRVVSGPDERLIQQLARDLSDRVHVIEPELGIDGDFFVERIDHQLELGGEVLSTAYALEYAPQQPVNVFTFDDDTRGFDDGVFGSDIDDPDAVFIFDHPTQGQFNHGRFGR